MQKRRISFFDSRSQTSLKTNEQNAGLFEQEIPCFGRTNRFESCFQGLKVMVSFTLCLYVFLAQTVQGHSLCRASSSASVATKMVPACRGAKKLKMMPP